MGIVFLKIWEPGLGLLLFLSSLFYYVCFWTAAISVLELSSSRGGRENENCEANAEKIFLLKFQRRRGPTVLAQGRPGNVAVEGWQWGFS